MALAGRRFTDYHAVRQPPLPWCSARPTSTSLAGLAEAAEFAQDLVQVASERSPAAAAHVPQFNLVDPFDAEL